MSPVTIVWSMTAAAALTLAAVHGLVWALDRRAWANLAFAVLAFSVACTVPAELAMMYAQSAEEWGWWVRWCHLPIFFAIVSTVLFIRLYLGTGRLWLGGTLIGLRIVILLQNFSTQPNFNFREIHSIERITFLGEPVSVVAQAVTSPSQWIATVAGVLFAAYVLDATLTLWRAGDANSRRKAVVVGGSVFVFVTLTILYTQLMIWGIVRMPVMIAIPFLVTLCAMAFELSRDVLRAPRLARESDELRRELAHAGRVSMLGQLASSLAHELNQPLAAIQRNAEAATFILHRAVPDLAELRAIVDDIHKDDRRAADVIDHLRQLLKRSCVDLQSIALDTLVQDVRDLVRSDATAKHIVIECVVPLSLPRVAGDRVHLSQVLINLIINGMDAIGAGRRPTRAVTVAIQERAARLVEVAVTDSGTGIPPETLSHLFQPFFTTKPGGMGMGLAVSRTIIEAHGGRIWAENNAAGGATFRFTIPTAEQDPT